mmetsp:Transcript_36544/g.104434  ORF Transcript_36544/g.104434 Transcript_36544/m.104434 type:complete len:1005 (-) Transcript_36544:120-3134(-)
MDLALTLAEGFPEKAFLSIRVGDVRQQMQVKPGDGIHFDLKRVPWFFDVDVLEKIGSTQVWLSDFAQICGPPGQEAPGGRELQGDVEVPRPDGCCMRLSAKVALQGAQEPESPASSPKQQPAAREAALQAKEYLDGHGVQGLLRTMVHAMLVSRPRDPLAFMIEYLQEQHALAQQAEEEEEEEEDPGFSVDECPARLPDLSSHHSIAATVLKQHPEIYEQLRRLRTHGGVSLGRCIKPGMDNCGHPMVKAPGIFAGDDECYDCFRELFDPAISLLHNSHLLDTRHPTDLCPPRVRDASLDPAGTYVASARIEVARNLAATPMAPALTAPQRLGVESLLAAAFGRLQGSLRGTYRPLRGMGPQEEGRLAAARWLFREPTTAMMCSAGMARDWPDARGIFVADAGDFVVWVNEEDHIRIIAEQSGANVKAAFSRLCEVEGALRAVLQHQPGFAWSDRLGFLSTSLENLGTGLKVFVHTRLPLLSQQDGFRALSKRLKLQVRRDAEVAPDIWAVSNNRRLLTTEVDQVNTVIDGVEELLDAEVRLGRGEVVDLATIGPSNANGEPLDRRVSIQSCISLEATPEEVLEELPDFASMPGLGREDLPGFPVDHCPDELPDISRHQTLVAIFLKKDPAIYERLRHVKTRGGISLARCIKPGMDVCSHPMVRTAGLFAGDAECYECFQEVFNSVIGVLHPGHSLDTEHPSNLDPSQVCDVDVALLGAHVVSARISMSRSLRELPMPCALTLDQRREAEGLLAGALRSLGAELKGEYLPLRGSQSRPERPGGMSAHEEDQLRAEGTLFSAPDARLLLCAGLGRDWPDARGVFVNARRDLAAWVNEEEHLRLVAHQAGPDLKAAFRRLCKAEGAIRMALSDTASFAWSRHLGFLGSNPAMLGSAIQAEVFIRLPLLSKQASFRPMCKRLRLQARRDLDAGEDIWAISNIDRLGSSEWNQVNAVIKGVQLLAEAELKVRRGEATDPGIGKDTHADPAVAYLRRLVRRAALRTAAR